MLIKELENLAYEERLKEIMSLLLQEQKAQGTLSQYSQTLSYCRAAIKRTEVLFSQEATQRGNR